MGRHVFHETVAFRGAVNVQDHLDFKYRSDIGEERIDLVLERVRGESGDEDLAPRLGTEPLVEITSRTEFPTAVMLAHVKVQLPGEKLYLVHVHVHHFLRSDLLSIWVKSTRGTVLKSEGPGGKWQR